MNERIQELDKQAVDHALSVCDANGVYQGKEYLSVVKEKFAELIVKECTNVVEGGIFLHDQAPTALFAKECSGAIKRHFGVKE